MTNEELDREIREILARTEGLININNQGDSRLLSRRLQGLKDKLVYLKSKIHNSNEEDVENIKKALKD